MPADSFGAAGSLTAGGDTYRIFRVNTIDGAARLPYCLKVLLENLLRNEDGHLVTAAQIEALARWNPAAEPSAEIAFTPARVLLQDFTGVPCLVDLAAMREAMTAPRRRPGQGEPAAPGRADHRPLGDRGLLRPPGLAGAQHRPGVPAQRRAVRVPALGPAGAARTAGGAAGHRDLPPGQPRVPGQGGIRRGRHRIPGHPGRHRLAHPDGQRAGRARLGSRRDRGRGGDARPAAVHADPAGDRGPAVRAAARGRHRHRPGTHHRRAAPLGRGGRHVRRVLRARRRGGAGGQPGHDRQHEPGVRLHQRDFPHRRGDPRLPAAHRPPRAAGSPRGGLRQGAGAVARPRPPAGLLTRPGPGHGRGGPVDRRAETTAGPHPAGPGAAGVPRGTRPVRPGAPTSRTWPGSTRPARNHFPPPIRSRSPGTGTATSRPASARPAARRGGRATRSRPPWPAARAWNSTTGRW